MTRLLALTALFALLAAPAAAAPLSQITVTADGRSSVMPDMAVAGFSISTYAQTAMAALSQNNARYERLLRALTSLGVAKSDVQTASFGLNYTPPPKPPDLPQQGVRYGYAASRSINVTIHNLASVGKTIDAAVAAGVTDVNDVSFGTSDTRGQFAKALNDAVQRARAHAESMAAAAGLRIVRVKAMQEGGATLVRPGITADVYRAAPVPTQIEPSAVETRATVTITFEAGST